MSRQHSDKTRQRTYDFTRGQPSSFAPPNTPRTPPSDAIMESSRPSLNSIDAEQSQSYAYQQPMLCAPQPPNFVYHPHMRTEVNMSRGSSVAYYADESAYSAPSSSSGQPGPSQPYQVPVMQYPSQKQRAQEDAASHHDRSSDNRNSSRRKSSSKQNSSSHHGRSSNQGGPSRSSRQGGSQYHSNSAQRSRDREQQSSSSRPRAQMEVEEAQYEEHGTDCCCGCNSSFCFR